MQLEQLLLRGADPNQVQVEPIFKLRPLHAAIIATDSGGSLEQVQVLLNYGADINATSLGLGGGTPLLCALFNDLDDVARFLLGAGADPNAPGGEGDSPLRWCVEQGDHDMAAHLLSKGAARTIDGYGGPEGRTALGLAVNRLDVEMVELLLRAGASADALDLDHNNAFQCLPALNESNKGQWHKIAVALSKDP